MQTWDFASSKIAERQYCRQHINSRLRAIALILALTTATVAGSFVTRTRIRQRMQTIETRLNSEQGLSSVTRREAALADQSRRELEWQNLLAQSTDRWVSVIGSISSQTSGSVYLSRMLSSESKGLLSLEGTAQSYQSLSLFLTKLRASRGISDVRLTDAKMAVSGDGSQVDFAIDIQMPSQNGAQISEKLVVPKLGESS